MSGTQPAIKRTLAEADTCSLKRLAWAYGCSPKGSDEERKLEMILLRRADPELNEIAASWSAVAIEMGIENAILLAEISDLKQRLEYQRHLLSKHGGG